MTDTTDQKKLGDLHHLGGSISPEWNMLLVSETIAAGYSTGEQKLDKVRNPTTSDAATATIAALSALAPADEIEGALAGQVVAFHGAALDALRRAAHPSGEDVATMWARAAELNRGMLDSLAALERRQAARKQPEPPAPAALDAGPAAAPATNQYVPPPPPPPTSSWPASRTVVDPGRVFTNEELRARGGYRTAGVRDGAGDATGAASAPADTAQAHVDAERRAYGYREDSAGSGCDRADAPGADAPKPMV